MSKGYIYSMLELKDAQIHFAKRVAQLSEYSAPEEIFTVSVIKVKDLVEDLVRAHGEIAAKSAKSSKFIPGIVVGVVGLRLWDYRQKLLIEAKARKKNTE